MTSKENEKIIKDLLSYDIRYPLIIKGYDNRDFKIDDIYIRDNNIMMTISVNEIEASERLRSYSYLFQLNLIHQLKKFKTNIWND